MRRFAKHTHVHADLHAEGSDTPAWGWVVAIPAAEVGARASHLRIDRLLTGAGLRFGHDFKTAARGPALGHAGSEVQVGIRADAALLDVARLLLAEEGAALAHAAEGLPAAGEVAPPAPAPTGWRAWTTGNPLPPALTDFGTGPSRWGWVIRAPRPEGGWGSEGTALVRDLTALGLSRNLDFHVEEGSISCPGGDMLVGVRNDPASAWLVGHLLARLPGAFVLRRQTWWP